MKKLVITLAMLAMVAVMALSACGAGESNGTDHETRHKTYDVTLYDGGTEVRKWTGVSKYVIYSDGRALITVDGETVTVINGMVVIEESEEE